MPKSMDQLILLKNHVQDGNSSNKGTSLCFQFSFIYLLSFEGGQPPVAPKADLKGKKSKTSLVCSFSLFLHFIHPYFI